MESYQQPTEWRLKLCIFQFSANPHTVIEQREPTHGILSRHLSNLLSRPYPLASAEAVSSEYLLTFLISCFLFYFSAVSSDTSTNCLLSVKEALYLLLIKWVMLLHKWPWIQYIFFIEDLHMSFWKLGIFVLCQQEKLLALFPTICPQEFEWIPTFSHTFNVYTDLIIYVCVHGI